MKLDFRKEQIEDAIDRVVRRTMKMDLSWDWPCGVAYYGISEAYLATGREEYLKLLKERIDDLIALGLPQHWTVNACAMGHALIVLHQATGEEQYWELVKQKVAYISQEAPRFGEGTLQHTVSAKNDFPEQAWADTLFMAAFVLLRVGIIEKNEALINDALDQWQGHIRYLQDMDSGLFYHGYDHIAKNHMSGIFWGRANAWAAYTMSQVGPRLPECYLYPQFLDVAGSLNEQLAALKALQTADGLWRTVLNDETSYEEVSAAAGIAAAMMARGNPLHSRHVDKALTGILANITPDGRVLNVSAGTAVMRDTAAYCQITKDWIQGWGQGLALAFFAEVLRGTGAARDGAL